MLYRYYENRCARPALYGELGMDPPVILYKKAHGEIIIVVDKAAVG
jgi:hypothetical protein